MWLLPPCIHRPPSTCLPPGNFKQQVKKPKRGSGNPAKRVEEERAAALRKTAAGTAALDTFELPTEFKNLLPPG